MNVSPQKFLTQLRMEDAQQQLVNTDDPIQVISRRVGYKDEFTFIYM